MSYLCCKIVFVATCTVLSQFTHYCVRKIESSRSTNISFRYDFNSIWYWILIAGCLKQCSGHQKVRIFWGDVSVCVKVHKLPVSLNRKNNACCKNLQIDALQKLIWSIILRSPNIISCDVISCDIVSEIWLSSMHYAASSVGDLKSKKREGGVFLRQNWFLQIVLMNAMIFAFWTFVKNTP